MAPRCSAYDVGGMGAVLSRRGLMAAGSSLLAIVPNGPADLEADILAAVIASRPPGAIFAVNPTADPQIDGLVSRPSLAEISLPDLREALASPVVFLGEHHNSKEDHRLQLRLLNEFAAAKPVGTGAMVLGLEQVERQFQPVLDEFSEGKIGLQELYRRTEWNTRWSWPFSGYAPVLELARNLGFEFLALNTNSEVQRRVPVEGLASLSTEERVALIPDASGFVQTTKLPGFKEYANQVIMPSYDSHLEGGWLGTTDRGLATPGGFLSARMIRDEAMCVPVAKRLAQRPGARALVLVGADHVKFKYGMPARMDRLLGDGPPRRRKPGTPSVVSILLNVQPQDTLSQDEKRLLMGLLYADAAAVENQGTLKLADFLVFSASKEKLGLDLAPAASPEGKQEAEEKGASTASDNAI
eukprot:CAMPEP_0118974938 /NCGR_PEP_ID=MMETSP1173-20130426/13990_1 /TAXON_ID=1034831 /ORGANISM="Rhizochromulina marina cf, Strain CCMP1243" /LENGTH=412 /DNA_ID=CAMNT_0006924755 /DNA_START=238 /DNA_END=1476 /DNA_ORIENTATION=+